MEKNFHIDIVCMSIFLRLCFANVLFKIFPILIDGSYGKCNFIWTHTHTHQSPTALNAMKYRVPFIHALRISIATSNITING